jgi:hypothetical protein
MKPSRFPPPSLERAFLQSVVYASLFDYPVTLAQLREGLIAQTADEHTLARCYTASDLLRSNIECLDGYYFPRGRRDLLDTRQRREVVSRKLLRELSMPLALIASMPFVRMVALSGSLAHLNADGEADLDLFVITTRARVWSVTLTALAITRLFGWRKRLCLNYVISERTLMVSPADLFCANQIVHLQPVCGVEVYRTFLNANHFIERFYPNFRPRSAMTTTPDHGSRVAASAMRIAETGLDWTVAPLYERVCRLIYGRHLRARAHTWRSRDQVRLAPECLKLHTSSHRREVMERFERALERATPGLSECQRVEGTEAPVEALRRAESLPLRAVR